ncbi:MAG: class I adenylate cyclase [Thermodesulfobacteriota bacterium]
MAALLKKLFTRGASQDKKEKASKNGRPRLPAPEAPSEAEGQGAADEVALVHANLVFERYNAEKRAFLRDQLTPKKKVVFDLIPLLLHMDGVGLLEADDACQMSPHGVFIYEMGPETEASFKEAFPGRKFPAFRPRASYDPTLPIKSISLIGSLGSVAQNPKSDFDYWVCFEEEAFSRESLVYFQEKLRQIELWADKFAGAEIHFFPLNMDNIRADDFGVVTHESSGTALGKLLKEEFYRTLTMVAGQSPLWWVMPPGVTDEDYARLAEIVSRSNRLDGSKLTDMGNVRRIALGEFYGAAIWQINKTMGSPFKSILKMALLEEYIFNHGEKGLLCTELKQRLLANEEEVHLLDPYILMFERASAYLTQQERLDDLDLLRQSLYMKSGVKLALSDYRRTDLPRKKQVMVDLVRQWGWNHKQVEKLNTFHNWTFKESQKFSDETNAFIVRTFKNVAAEVRREKGVDLAISQRDLTVLGRKLYIFYQPRTNKVDSMRRVIEAPPALEGLTLQPHLDRAGRKIWAAFRALLSRETVLSGAGASVLLRTFPDLAHLLLWLVNNQLYDAGTTINLNSGTGTLETHCTVPDIQSLLKGMGSFFQPYKHSEIDEEELLKKPNLVRMLLVINLEESDKCAQLATTGLCYQNNWGEVFYKAYRGSQEGIKMARDFVRKHFKYDPLGALSNFRVFMPNRHFKRDLAPRMNKYFGLKAVV